MAKGKSNLIGVLDVGSAKTCCMIASTDSGIDRLRVVGIGHQESRGIRHGKIVDMEQAQNSIAHAVQAAEQAANVTLQEIYLSFSGIPLSSKLVNGSLNLHEGEVRREDLAQLLHQVSVQEEGSSKHDSNSDGTSLPRGDMLHLIPLGYAVDDLDDVSDPVGMIGTTLSARYHRMETSGTVVQNVLHAVGRCHLDVSGVIAAPYAAGLACLVEDERSLGTTIIDMGAGTTSFACFQNGQMMHADRLLVGGYHITHDLAHGLSISLQHAERLKNLYAHVLPARSDDRETIAVPLVGEDERQSSNAIPRFALNNIVRPRVEEVLELLRDKINSVPPEVEQATWRLVLTGGASQLPGLRDLASHVLGRPIRLGTVHGWSSQPESARTASFAVATGMLHYILDHAPESSWEPTRRRRLLPSLAGLGRGSGGQGRGGALGKTMGWLRENF
jgi:cell division protein FtsA